MFCEDVCLGVTCGIYRIRNLSDQLNAKVVDQVNGTQELVLLSSFARESSEYQFKQCLQDRISDISSWRWVLEDLTKRLEDAISGLKYEHNALRVVVKRVQDELNYYSRDASRPGALCPLTDIVEEAIVQEFDYLRNQKKSFEKLIEKLDKQTSLIEKTKKKIDNDLRNKIQALSIEETCANKDYKDVAMGKLTKKRKKGSPIHLWAKRCAALKRAGLKALCNAMITRQQIRGARIQLSIAAQAYAARIDTALRRRLHTNNIKLQDLKWQREEAIRDYASLDDELISIEKTLVETMDKERIIEARVTERSRRPSRELTKDDANRKLRQEQTRLRKFAKELRNNIGNITSLQNDLREAVGRIDCCAEDLVQVISLDEERIRCRQGEQSRSDSAPMPDTTAATMKDNSHVQGKEQLSVILEENEDDYPFDY